MNGPFSGFLYFSFTSTFLVPIFKRSPKRTEGRKDDWNA